MINWLLFQTMLTSVFLLFLFMSLPLLNRLFGAQHTYKIFLVFPLIIVAGAAVKLKESYFSELMIVKVIAENNKLAHFMDKTPDAFEYILLIVWLFGCTMLLLHLLSSHFRYVSSLKMLQLGTRFKDLPIFSSGKLRSPQLHGWLRPKIVVPDNFFQKFCYQQRSLILRHEYCHWRQGDNGWNFIALLLLSIFWFNPFVWRGYRQFRMQQELACDCRVLANESLSERKQYALTMMMISENSDTSLFTHSNYSETKFMKKRVNTVRLHKPKHLLPAVALIALLTGIFGTGQVLVAKESDSTPEPIYTQNPVYPEKAANESKEGWVQLSFDIEQDGSVSNVKVVKAEPRWYFEVAAETAFKHWRYDPQPNKKTDNQVILQFVLEDS